jgi:hypothetical protein
MKSFPCIHDGTQHIQGTLRQIDIVMIGMNGRHETLDYFDAPDSR